MSPAFRIRSFLAISRLIWAFPAWLVQQTFHPVLFFHSFLLASLFVRSIFQMIKTKQSLQKSYIYQETSGPELHMRAWWILRQSIFDSLQILTSHLLGWNLTFYHSHLVQGDRLLAWYRRYIVTAATINRAQHLCVIWLHLTIFWQFSFRFSFSNLHLCTFQMINCSVLFGKAS